MNTLNLISSSLALGAMMGISGTHYQQVKAMVEQASQSSAAEPVQMMVPTTESTMPVSTQIPITLAASTTTKSSPSKGTLSANPAVTVDQRDSALMEVLLAIRAEQKNIRNQVADTNRNMDELTFRVDSHSTQFRPLRAESQTPRAMIVPDDMLRPLNTGSDLLPPKP